MSPALIHLQWPRMVLHRMLLRPKTLALAEVPQESSKVHAQAAHDAELRRVLLRLTAALGVHVGGAGGAAAAAAAAAELSAESGAASSAEADWGSDGSSRFAHAKAPAPGLGCVHHVVEYQK